jgi:acetolactate synthase-1/3 small subunit
VSDKQITQHTISLLVNNRPGVLIRIALVFSRRGFNIDSVVVSPLKDQEYSRMSLVASGDPKTLDQIIKQLNKLVDVLHATDHTGHALIERELGLFKVQCPSSVRTEILQIADHFKASSVDMTVDTVVFQVTGTSEKLTAFQTMMENYGIIESIRSGKLFLMRGKSET